MLSLIKYLSPICLGLFLTGCTPSPPAPLYNAPAPGKAVYRTAAQRFAAVIVSDRGDVDEWIGNHFSKKYAPKEADGGSAAPIAPDGYFITANHVLSAASERQVFVVIRRDGRLRAFPARIVWQGSAGDVAILHSDVETPNYYRWTPSDRWLPRGTAVMHAGISTGFSSSSGKLVSPLPPDGGFRSSHRIRHDIPLEPGDSGGPLVNKDGLLIGVNSAVEYLVPIETPFFIESEANRPNVRKIMSVIAKDRKQRGGNTP